MEKRRLQPFKRHLRSCGHPADWTLDLKEMDGTITSYCMGCLIEKLGLKPIARHKIVFNSYGEMELEPIPL